MTFVKCVLASVLLLCATKISAAQLSLPIVGDVDGDTISTILPLPCPLCKASVRIKGIDTPEKGKKAKCSKEAMLASVATDSIKKLIGTSKNMVLTNYKWDKYGSRIDSDVFVDGVNIGAALIQLGVAKSYSGRGPKPDWCK